MEYGMEYEGEGQLFGFAIDSVTLEGEGRQLDSLGNGGLAASRRTGNGSHKLDDIQRDHTHLPCRHQSIDR